MRASACLVIIVISHNNMLDLMSIEQDIKRYEKPYFIERVLDFCAVGSTTHDLY